MKGFFSFGGLASSYLGPYIPNVEDGIFTSKPLGNGNGAPKGYYQFLPDDYSLTGTQTYPFLLWLGGSGTVGNGTSDLYKVYSESGAVPSILRSGIWNGKQDGFKFIVLMPQQTSGTQWPGSSGISDITEFKTWAKSYYRIDETRMYCSGFSMGGKGTYEAGALDNNPNEWAALAPICCANSTYQMGQACGNKNIPIFMYYSSNDGLDNEMTPYNGYLNTVDLGISKDFTDMSNGHNATRACSPTYYPTNMYSKLLTQVRSI